ncbi:MAG: hypothetical protein H0T73_16765 [Ardenticatenales bacterium]|nr:hypothetical protein [Ardenticatenales bacterium]
MPTHRRAELAALFLVLASFALWATGYLVQEPQAIIRWETESEVETLGFHVYRATEETGSYARVTEKLIPSSGDPFTGSAYEFRDPTVQAGQTYFYQLEELETSGTFTRLPDIVRFEARREANWWLVLLLIALFLAICFLPARLPTSVQMDTIKDAEF